MYLSTVHLCTVKFTIKSNRDKRLACFYGFSSDPDDRLQSPLQVVARVLGLKLRKPLRGAPSRLIFDKASGTKGHHQNIIVPVVAWA